MAVNIKCPVVTLDEWKSLVSHIGDVRAHISFFRNAEVIPDLERALDVLGLDKAQWRDKKGRTLYQVQQDVQRAAIESPSVAKIAALKNVAKNSQEGGLINTEEKTTPSHPVVPQVMTLDHYLASKGVLGVPSFPEYHRTPRGVSKQSAKAAAKRIQSALNEHKQKVSQLTEEYNAKVKSGEIRPPTRTEQLQRTSQGNGQAAEAARRLLSKPTSNAKSVIEVLNTARQLKISAPKGATMIRATTPDGKVSIQAISNVQGENLFRGANISNIEAGTIGKDKKFVPMNGDVKVEDRTPIKNENIKPAGDIGGGGGNPPVRTDLPQVLTSAPGDNLEKPETPKPATSSSEPAANLGAGLKVGEGSSADEVRSAIAGQDTAGFAVDVISRDTAVELTGKKETFGYGGFFFNGRIYLVADNIARGKTAELHQLLREEVGHGLLRTTEGNRQLQSVLEAGKLNLTEAEKAALRAKGYQEHQLLDEFIAKSARENLPWWTKAAEQIRVWLSKAGLVNLTNDEVARLLLKNIVRAGNDIDATGTLPEVAPSEPVKPKESDQTPIGIPAEPLPADVDDPDEGIKTQIAGNDYFVQGKDLLQPAQKRAADARALSFLNSLKLPVEPDDQNVATLTPDGFNHDAEARRLIDELTTAIQRQNSPGGDPAYSSALVRFINYNVSPDGGWYKILSQDVANQLIGISAGESSWRGWMLRAVQGIQKDLLTVASNLPVFLNKTYALAFGGKEYEKFFKRFVEHFRGFFTADEVAKLLKDNPGMEADLNKLIAVDQATAADRLYRAVQRKLSTSKTSPAKLEKNALFNEELNTILESLKKYGVKEPPKAETLSPLEKLRLMVTDANKDKISVAIWRAIETGEIEAGKQAARNELHGNADDLAELEARYEAGELPTADQITSGLQLPNFEKWSRMREEWAGYDPVTVRLAKQVAEGDFRGLKFQTPKVKPMDTRISITELAKSPDSEVERVLNAYLENIRSNIDLDGVSPETKRQVASVIREQLLNQINEVIRPRIRDLMFEASKRPDKLTPDERAAQLVNAKLFSDTRLDAADLVDRVASKSAIRNLLPKVSDLVSKILNTPTAQQAGMKAEFLREMVDRLGVPQEQAAAAWKVLDAAITPRLKLARESAQKAAIKAMTPEERAALPQTDGKLWKAITQFFNAGGTDSAALLRKIAEAKGYATPTDEQVSRMQQMAAEIQRLSRPNARTESSIKGDTMLTDAEKTKALATATDEAQAANGAEIKKLQQAIGVDYAKFTKPINFQNKQNMASAGYEFATANLLAKFGFPIRLTTHIITQLFVRTATRPLAVAFQAALEDKSAANLISDIQKAYADTFTQTLNSVMPALRAARAQMTGRGAIMSFDRLMHSITGLERAAAKAKEYADHGDYIRSSVLYMISTLRLAQRVVGAIDGFQGEFVEATEMRHQIFLELQRMGKTRAEITITTDGILNAMKSEWITALGDAKRIFEDYESDPKTLPTGFESAASKWSKGQRENAMTEAADKIVKSRAYDTIALAGMPADSMKAYIRRQRMAEAWQEPTKYGVGGVVSRTMSNIRSFGTQIGVPFFPVEFSNAIGAGINYHLRLTPFYKLADIGAKGNTAWAERPLDITHNQVRAIFGTLVGTTLGVMVLNHMLRVYLHAPTDKKEREKFIQEGHKAGTVEILLPDGSFIPFSITVGPFAVVSPYLAGFGGAANLIDSRAKAQARLNVEAKAKGIPAGHVAPVNAADVLAIAGEAAWNTILGGSTASGLVGGYSEFGIPNATKGTAALVSPFVPYLPAYQEVSRMMGVQMDKNMASVFDYLVPLPTSAGRMVNSLGDPVRTPNDAQRIIQAITAGSYPLPVSPSESVVNQDDRAAYQALFASGFRPPAIEPGRGYNIGGEMRPMNSDELERYTVLRGQYLKEGLSALGASATPQKAAAAYKQANARALADIGVQKSTPASAARATTGATRATARRRMTSLYHRPARHRYARIGRIPRRMSGLRRRKGSLYAKIRHHRAA